MSFGYEIKCISDGEEDKIRIHNRIVYIDHIGGLRSWLKCISKEGMRTNKDRRVTIVAGSAGKGKREMPIFRRLLSEYLKSIGDEHYIHFK